MMEDKFEEQSFKYVMTRKDKLISACMFLGVIIELYFIIFNHNWVRNDLLSFIGILCFVLAGILVLSSNILKKKGGMKDGGGFVTTKLVDSGIYSIIRHPIYLSLVYIFLGVALLAQHPLSIFFGIINALFCYYFMLTEEKLTKQKFGQNYLDYMSKVPRSNLLLGIWRRIKQR